MNTNNDLSTSGFYPGILNPNSSSLPPPLTQPFTPNEKTTSSLENLKEAISKLGIDVKEKLQFSLRQMIMNSVPSKLIQTIDSGFSKKLENLLAQDWNIGISKSYIDLELSRNQELRKQVVEENFRYAAYMYLGFQYGIEDGQLYVSNEKTGQETGIVVPRDITLPRISPEHMKTINRIKEKLSEMGFEADPYGNYYHTKTGSLFNLIFDEDKNEMIVCFMGLDNERHLEIDDTKKKKITSENIKGAVTDWIGGVPNSAIQAIEIGKMLKEMTQNSGLTPVVVGHSHGGGLAQATAVANGIKGVVFNSRPMGVGIRHYLGESRLQENSQYLTAFSGKRDWLTDNSILNRLAKIVQFLGLPVPRTVGTGYYLPNLPDRNLAKVHNGFYDAISILKNKT